MATTIKQIEDAPEAYPDIGLSDSPPAVDLSDEAAALDADMLWQRIEAWVSYRWSERDVVWIVEGPGEWTLPLTPATVSTVEIWQDETWVSFELGLSPIGYCLPGGSFRFTATVGGSAGDVPAAVIEAFRRLAEYTAATPGEAGAHSETTTAGSVTIATRRNAAWMAHAMQNSGAGDLLRKYRRA